MNQSLQTVDTSDFQEKFQKLRSDVMEILLSDSGLILSVNETAASFFSEYDSFFRYVPSKRQQQVKQFLETVRRRGECEGFPVHHCFHQDKQYVQYNGEWAEGYILLSGRNMSRSRFSIETSELLQQFEHAGAIINGDMGIEMHNEAFESYMHPETENGHGIIQNTGYENLLNSSAKQDVIPKLVEEVLEKQKPLELEVKNDQAENWLYLKGIYLAETDSVLLMIYDLTYEKKYHRLLTYQDQMESVSYLSAGVAHELRNPLSVIKGFLQLSSLTESFYKYSDTILSEVERMNEIIDNFLSVARKKVQKEWKMPGDLLDSVIDMMRSECLMQGVLFDYQVDPVEGVIEVNESSFKQIILNALRNSMDAFPDGQKNNKFSLESFERNGHLIIQLKDNGPGIPAHVLENLGKPFFTTKEKGTGVGIPLCKKIMEEHNGTFEVESGSGKGTNINLSFPIYREE
ncbi:sensor histidine kinase [Salibacterium halotolerans]|uniref:histidine kinase n=1 Tax=Salibacterium halotolerans TaxID=1884432 RepID=A0A1I5NI59_9BACI|nr:HAMP domain-containing sensor histidine kinase [Salibacterium halotolerans]SFP21454.1 Signal transduction histidine kinase [Salibacterium halotolerans]